MLLELVFLLANQYQMKKPAIPPENLPKKEWENPMNPEKADDQRDLEKLERAKKEADRRNNNLTEEDN